jgi:hypothetical protein
MLRLRSRYRHGVDYRSPVAAHAERLAGSAVPLLSASGDVLITDRPLPRGSEPLGRPPRHLRPRLPPPRRRARRQTGAHAGAGRTQAVALGVACRRARAPEEAPFVYTPLAGARVEWDPNNPALATWRLEPLAGTLRL